MLALGTLWFQSQHIRGWHGAATSALTMWSAAEASILQCPPASAVTLISHSDRRDLLCLLCSDSYDRILKDLSLRSVVTNDNRGTARKAEEPATAQ